MANGSGGGSNSFNAPHDNGSNGSNDHSGGENSNNNNDDDCDNHGESGNAPPNSRALYRSRHLGAGTSAMAEVQGIILAAELFQENEPADDMPLYFFTDNRAAIRVATGAKTPWV